MLGKSMGGAATAEAPERASPDDVQGYDFRRPRRISTDKLRSLKAIYESVAKSLEGYLVSRVRGDVQIVLQSVEQYSFGEFTLSLPSPCASYTYQIANSGGQEGVVDFGNEFAYFLVDRLFGGGTDVATPARALTPLERMGVRSVAERATALLADGWREYVEMDFTQTGFESVPEMLRVANREDPVLVANLEVTAGAQRSLLVFCLPFAVLEKFFAGSSERRATILGSTEEQQMNQRLAERALRSTRVIITARLPEFRMSLRELLALQTGSLVSTGIPRNAELDVLIGRQQRFLATPGRVGSALAVRLSNGVLPAPETMTIPPSRQNEVRHVRRSDA